MSTESAMTAQGLRKRYGDTQALDGFDLEVRAGTIHGLLGPNGAGKSTAVSALCTLIEVDYGTASIAGHDVATEGQLVRSRIGLVGQSPAVDEVLGGRQNLVLFGRLFGLRKSAAVERAAELLDRFELTQAAERPVATYSGGMRRRLDIAAGLIRRPAVLFLDEPTTGLDPRGRNEVWATVREVAGEGTTVLLTTQYLDEADQLADSISVMDAGRVIAEGTPEELKRQRGGNRLEVVIKDSRRLQDAMQVLGGALGVPARASEGVRTITLEVPDRSTALLAAVRALDSAELEADDLVLRRPTLDEVFLALTETDPARSARMEAQ
ncbi:ABC-2 type transport system ATP-binding protein [Arthrobacter pigmenti]|uniref:ABC-2 type transport system ATP-binding protein n=1 Tax=Arthrobacter pigmenti TaxID=271432 RepID=A0A846RSL3_9MICC|nr:ATP-binding cassette domain-containing protein [Arthrobacter pigmenti]NJC21301.1 ABC-2 type transport system ATP-binding protein [Arthrobacter pigmenti]